MYFVVNPKGSIEVSQDAIQGMLISYLEEKNLQDVQFLGFRKPGGAISGVGETVKRLFNGGKKPLNEEEEDSILIFNLEFKILKLHPIHIKALEIQSLVNECLEFVLGVSDEQVQVNVFFTSYKDQELEVLENKQRVR